MWKILTGFLGCGSLAALSYFVTSYFSGDSNKIVDYFKKRLKQEQDEDIGKVKDKQDIIARQVKIAEKASKESKEKVDQILKKAVMDVNRILKEDDLKKIDNVVDGEWEDL